MILSASIEQVGLALAAAAAIAVFGLVGNMDYEDALAQEALYCDMVAEWQSSRGKRGHPNLDNLDCEGRN